MQMRDRFENDDPKTGEGTPRWVKVFGIVSAVLVLVVVIVLLTGGGNHGPSRHTSSGDAGAPSVWVPAAGGRADAALR